MHSAALCAAGATVPRLYAALWTDDHAQGTLVLDDLHTSSAQAVDAEGAAGPQAHANSSEVQPAGGGGVRNSGQSGRHSGARSPCQRLALSYEEACVALRWLARFHAHFWLGNDSPAGHHSTTSSSQMAWTSGGLWTTGGRPQAFKHAM